MGACFIYRLFTTGTIDEKIYQRQICKDGLSTMMVTETGEVDPASTKESLASELVKDLFTFDETTACATHDMLACTRCAVCDDATRVRPGGCYFCPQEAEAVEDDLNTWSHHKEAESVGDRVLEEAAKRMRGADALREIPDLTADSGRACHVSFTM